MDAGRRSPSVRNLRTTSKTKDTDGLPSLKAGDSKEINKTENPKTIPLLKMMKMLHDEAESPKGYFSSGGDVKLKKSKFSTLNQIVMRLNDDSSFKPESLDDLRNDPRLKETVTPEAFDELVAGRNSRTKATLENLFTECKKDTMTAPKKEEKSLDTSRTSSSKSSERSSTFSKKEAPSFRGRPGSLDRTSPNPASEGKGMSEADLEKVKSTKLLGHSMTIELSATQQTIAVEFFNIIFGEELFGGIGKKDRTKALLWLIKHLPKNDSSSPENQKMLTICTSILFDSAGGEKEANKIIDMIVKKETSENDFFIHLEEQINEWEKKSNFYRGVSREALGSLSSITDEITLRNKSKSDKKSSSSSASDTIKPKTAKPTPSTSSELSRILDERRKKSSEKK